MGGKKKRVRKGDPITSYLCSGGLIRGAYHNIMKFNYNLYSSLDVYQKRCVLYKLLISLRCMNESPTVAACVLYRQVQEDVSINPLV